MELKIWFENILIRKLACNSSKLFSMVHSTVYLNEIALKNSIAKLRINFFIKQFD